MAEAVPRHFQCWKWYIISIEKPDFPSKYPQGCDEAHECCWRFFLKQLSPATLCCSNAFFAMKSSGYVPHANAFPQGIASKSVSERARSFQDKVLQVVDRYVLLSGLSALTQQHKDDNSSKQSATSRKRPMEHKDDPHLQRIAADHCYGSQRLEPPKKKRRLPEYIAKHSDIPHVSVDQQQQAPDGVLNYSSAILNDGLLMLELRDAIREGDGPRIIQCWWSTLSMQSMSTMQRRHFKCWPTYMLLEHLDLYISSHGEELLIHMEDWATTYHWTFTWNTWTRN